MRRVWFVVFIFCLCVSVAPAQYTLNENKIWNLGSHVKVDFTSGSPATGYSAINSTESNASVCDASGALLFYTDGRFVYDRTGAIMTSSASGIAPMAWYVTSTSQGTAIAQVQGTTNKYYVFSLESYTLSPGHGHLVYCIVDMSLSGGMGDVVASTIGTPVGNKFAEKMVTVAGNNCDLWLLVHHVDSAIFYAYNINAAGISTMPVISRVGTLTGDSATYIVGTMKVSPDRSKIGLNVYATTGGQGCELFDFNPTTGIVSNCRTLDSLNDYYGGEFSPDNTKYYGAVMGGNIYQWDVTGASAAAIRATRYTVYSTNISDLRLGSNGKIYLGNIAGSSLDVIANPNISGSGCSYITSAVSLASGTAAMIGMGNVYWSVGSLVTFTRRKDTSACISVGHPIVLSADTTGYSYLWNDGITTRTRNVTSTGTYYVRINNGCQVNIDTIVVTHLPFDTTTSRREITVCVSDAPVTISGPSGYSTYQWNTGATTATISVSTAGTYWVMVYDSCGNSIVDTTVVHFNPRSLEIGKTTDTSICINTAAVRLQSPANGYASYLWQDGSTNSSLTVNTSGVYYAIASGYCKDRIDTFKVNFTNLTFSIGPDTTVCINYPIMVPVAGPGVTYLWHDGYNQQTYSAYRTGTYSVTVNDNGCVASDTINVTFFHFTQNLHDTFICNGTPIAYNLVCNVPAGGSVLWNDGLTTPTRTITESGTWWVYVSKDQCEILDTVRVTTGFCNCWVEIPSAFTPNSDGINDVFRPTIEPGCTYSGYQLTVYNRWGEAIFTSDKKGQGWDGTWNGTPADMGTYMYSLNLYIGVNDIPTLRKGSFTLIR